MCLRWSLRWEQYSYRNVRCRRVFLLLTAIVIMFSPIIHCDMDPDMEIIHLTSSQPILISAPSSSSKAPYFEDKLSRSGKTSEEQTTKKYYYAVKSPPELDFGFDFNSHNREIKRNKFERMNTEAQSYSYDFEHPELVYELPSEPEYEEYSSIQFHPHASYNVGNQNQNQNLKSSEDDRRSQPRHPYYGRQEVLEKSFGQSQQIYSPPPSSSIPVPPPRYSGSHMTHDELDFMDHPPPIISHPIPQPPQHTLVDEFGYGNQRPSFSRFKPAQIPGNIQASQTMFRPSQADSFGSSSTSYESSNAYIPTDQSFNLQPGGSIVSKPVPVGLPGSQPGNQPSGQSMSSQSTTKPNTNKPPFHQQIIVNINNHREVEIQPSPSPTSSPSSLDTQDILKVTPRPQNEQISTGSYSVQRPPGQPKPPGSNNFRPNQQYGPGPGSGFMSTPQFQTSVVQMQVQSGYGSRNRFSQDIPTRGNFSPNNGRNKVYRRSPSNTNPVQVASGDNSNWRPIIQQSRNTISVNVPFHRPGHGHSRQKRSTSTWSYHSNSNGDQEGPLSFSLPILSPDYILRKRRANENIPSYAVLDPDSDFVSVEDFHGDEIDFDLLISRNSNLRQLDDHERAGSGDSGLTKPDLSFKFVPAAAHVDNNEQLSPMFNFGLPASSPSSGHFDNHFMQPSVTDFLNMFQSPPLKSSSASRWDKHVKAIPVANLLKSPMTMTPTTSVHWGNSGPIFPVDNSAHLRPSFMPPMVPLDNRNHLSLVHFDEKGPLISVENVTHTPPLSPSLDQQLINHGDHDSHLISSPASPSSSSSSDNREPSIPVDNAAKLSQLGHVVNSNPEIPIHNAVHLPASGSTNTSAHFGNHLHSVAGDSEEPLNPVGNRAQMFSSPPTSALVVNREPTIPVEMAVLNSPGSSPLVHMDNKEHSVANNAVQLLPPSPPPVQFDNRGSLNSIADNNDAHLSVSQSSVNFDAREPSTPEPAPAHTSALLPPSLTTSINFDSNGPLIPVSTGNNAANLPPSPIHSFDDNEPSVQIDNAVHLPPPSAHFNGRRPMIPNEKATHSSPLSPTFHFDNREQSVGGVHNTPNLPSPSQSPVNSDNHEAPFSAAQLSPVEPATDSFDNPEPLTPVNSSDPSHISSESMGSIDSQTQSIAAPVHSDSSLPTAVHFGDRESLNQVQNIDHLPPSSRPLTHFDNREPLNQVVNIVHSLPSTPQPTPTHFVNRKPLNQVDNIIHSLPSPPPPPSAHFVNREPLNQVDNIVHSLPSPPLPPSTHFVNREPLNQVDNNVQLPPSPPPSMHFDIVKPSSPVDNGVLLASAPPSLTHLSTNKLFNPSANPANLSPSAAVPVDKNNRVSQIPILSLTRLTVTPSSSSSAVPSYNRNQSHDFVPAIDFRHTIGSNGEYNAHFAAANGIKSAEKGYMENTGGSHSVDKSITQENPSYEYHSGRPSIVKIGSSSWTSPEGYIFHLNYIADRNGYRPNFRQEFILREPVSG